MILAVHSYPGANGNVARNYPFWSRANFSLICGIGTAGGRCVWPPCVSHTIVGIDSYQHGDVLPRRLIDTIGYLLSRPEDFDFAAIIEHDTVIFRPLRGVRAHLCMVETGGQSPGFRGTKFYHNPWVADRPTWGEVYRRGLQMIAENDIELGWPDRFIGWLAERWKIPVCTDAFTLYTRNALDTPQYLEEARSAYRNGIDCIHGVKTGAQLDYILA